MTTDYYDQFCRIADEMNRTRASSKPEISYELFADALVWTDEYPEGYKQRLGAFDCIKLLLRYRTTLILGNPDALLKPYWDEARALFPQWAGFDAARQREDERLRAIYERYHSDGLDWVEQLG